MYPRALSRSHRIKLYDEFDMKMLSPYGSIPGLVFYADPYTGLYARGPFQGIGTFVNADAINRWFQDPYTGLYRAAAANEIRVVRGTDGKLYWLLEPAATNLALWCRDWTQAGTWAATNITPLKNVTGIDGAANSASRLTADADNGTIFQTVAAEATTRYFTVFVKRISGTGGVYITQNGGTNYTEITSSLSTSSWYRASLSASILNPAFGIKLATSGDVIAVDFAQLEATAFYTSPILTTTGSATRTTEAGSLTFPINAALAAALGTGGRFTVMMGVTLNFPSGLTGIQDKRLLVGDANANVYLFSTGGSPTTGFYGFDGTGYCLMPSRTWSAGQKEVLIIKTIIANSKFWGAYKRPGGSVTWNSSQNSYDGSMNPGTTIRPFYNMLVPVNISFIAIFDRELSSPEIESYCVGKGF